MYIPFAVQHKFARYAELIFCFNKWLNLLETREDVVFSLTLDG
jgi:hypothetical protein